MVDVSSKFSPEVCPAQLWAYLFVLFVGLRREEIQQYHAILSLQYQLPQWSVWACWSGLLLWYVPWGWMVINQQAGQPLPWPLVTPSLSGCSYFYIQLWKELCKIAKKKTQNPQWQWLSTGPTSVQPSNRRVLLRKLLFSKVIVFLPLLKL